MPDGSYIMDSRKIGEALDKMQPEPSLHMDQKDIIDRAQAVVNSMRGGLLAIVMPRVPPLLNDRSAEYFERTRAARFGMSLSELAKSEKAGENAWKNAEPGMKDLKSLLNENNDGPYILGKEVSFADFVVTGMWAFLKLLDKNGDLYDRAMKFDPSFSEHMNACQKWLERDDH